MNLSRLDMWTILHNVTPTVSHTDAVYEFVCPPFLVCDIKLYYHKILVRNQWLHYCYRLILNFIYLILLSIYQSLIIVININRLKNHLGLFVTNYWICNMQLCSCLVFSKAYSDSSEENWVECILLRCRHI